MNDTQPTGLQLAVKLLAQIGDNDSDAAIAAVHAVMDPGQPGELPDGLQLAAILLDDDRDAFICGQAHPVHGLEPSDEEIAAGYLTAIAAIRAEHAQRLTLQHHAADQVWRIADLEVKCVTLKGLHDAATDERDALRVKVSDLERAAVKRREISDGVEAELVDECDTLRTLKIRAESERDELRAKYDELLVALHGIGRALGLAEGDRSPYSVTCGVLERVNRLAEIEAQEPVVKIHTDGYWTARRGHDPLSDGKAFLSVYANPVPAQAVPMSDERIDAIAELVIKGMPDGICGFMRTWGYQQFARALLEVCAGHYRAQAVPEGWRLLAWAHDDGRVIPVAMMDTAKRDGGATFSSVKAYTIPLYAAPEHKA